MSDTPETDTRSTSFGTMQDAYLRIISANSRELNLFTLSAKQKWNLEADEYNQWSELSQDEKEMIALQYEKDKNHEKY